MINYFKSVKQFMTLPQVQCSLLQTTSRNYQYILASRKLSLSAHSNCKNSKISHGSDVQQQNSKNESEAVIKKNEDVVMSEKEIIECLKQENSIYPYKTENEKLIQILKNDFIYTRNEFVQKLTGIKLGQCAPQFVPKETDCLIIGGGIVGLSIAYAIRSEFPYGMNVAVIDKNEFAPTTCTLASGTVIQQNFSEEIEIQMANYCIEFLRTFSRHTMMAQKDIFKVPFDPLGSLVLADEECGENVLNNFDWHKKYSIPSEYLTPDDIKKMFPWLKADDALFGILNNRNSGLINPNEVLTCMKCKLVNLGVDFINGEVLDYGANNNRIRRVVYKSLDNTYNSIDFSKCFIAGGTESLKLIDIINNMEDVIIKMKFPLEEKMIYEYCFYNPYGPGLNTPIVINTDGVYFRREGLSGLYVVGVPSVPANNDKENGIYEIFDSKVKPFLSTRFDCFKDLELRNGWVQKYTTNKANDIGIIGPHPTREELFFAIGFTKCGFLFGPAVGRGLMEYIMYDNYLTIDFRLYHPENLYLRQHLEAESKLRLKQIENSDRQYLSE